MKTNSTKQLRGILPQEMLSLLRKLVARHLGHADMLKVVQLLMGLMHLMDGRKIYDERFFNQIRQHLKYSDTTHMLRAVQQSEAFILICRDKVNSIVGFASPLVNCNVVAPEGCHLVQPRLTITGSDELVTINESQYMYISKDIAERPNKGGRSGKDLMPEPTAETLAAATAYFGRMKQNAEAMEAFFGTWRKDNHDRYGFTDEELDETVLTLIDNHLTPHIARRKGIERWEDKWIDSWVKNIMKTKLFQVFTSKTIEAFRTRHAEQRDREMTVQMNTHPYSQYEWVDTNGNRMYYDPLEMRVCQIPVDAPARPGDDAVFNAISKTWKTIKK